MPRLQPKARRRPLSWTCWPPRPPLSPGPPGLQVSGCPAGSWQSRQSHCPEQMHQMLLKNINGTKSTNINVFFSYLLKWQQTEAQNYACCLCERLRCIDCWTNIFRHTDDKSRKCTITANTLIDKRDKTCTQNTHLSFAIIMQISNLDME